MVDAVFATRPGQQNRRCKDTEPRAQVNIPHASQKHRQDLPWSVLQMLAVTPTTSVLRFFLGSRLLHRLARLMLDLLSLFTEPVADWCSCSNMALTRAFFAACAGVSSASSSARRAAAAACLALPSGSSAPSAAASPSTPADAPRLCGRLGTARQCHGHSKRFGGCNKLANGTVPCIGYSLHCCMCRNSPPLAASRLCCSPGPVLLLSCGVCCRVIVIIFLIR